VHDIRAIRADPAGFDAAMMRRGIAEASAPLLAIDAELRATTAELQFLQKQRNEVSKQIGALKRTGASTEMLERQGIEIRRNLAKLESRPSELEARLSDLLAGLPNKLDLDVPDGKDESGNAERFRVNNPTPTIAALQHFELGEHLGMMDFEAAARIAGSRFTVLRGPLARLERALGQWMIDLHTTEHGYEETAVPLLVNDATAYGSNQLPKFAEDMFRTTDGRWLIPTAEVPLTNLVAGQILPAERLPIRVTALTDCFRSEAGSAGRDTRGMLRQHQFRKVELVSVTQPDDSDAEHERMTACAESVLGRLGLTYRRMLLCAGDTGFGAAKTFDLEVWLPGQGAWREISSCSNTRAFQARRMNARVRGADGKPVFVHTLNGSGVAVGRALIAVMETHQQADGSIAVPTVLRSYMGGLDCIRA